MSSSRRSTVGTLVLLAACTSLAGCKTLDQIEQAKDYRDFAIRAGGVTAQLERVRGNPEKGLSRMPGTTFEHVPTTGSATFTGSAFVSGTNENNRRETYVLVGDASVTVDFGANAVSGEVTDFRQTETNAVSTNIGGRLTLDGGEVGSGAPNNLAFDYEGQVFPDDERIDLDGRLTGKLRGTRPDATGGQSVVKAIDVADDDPTMTRGGDAFNGRVSIVAEN